MWGSCELWHRKDKGEATASSLGKTVEERVVLHRPLNGRNFAQLKQSIMPEYSGAGKLR